jgi:hypothetical protein
MKAGLGLDFEEEDDFDKKSKMTNPYGTAT